MTEWYYMAGTDRQGPVDFATLHQLFQQGYINNQTQVWSAELNQWTPWASAQNNVATAPIPPSLPEGPPPSDEEQKVIITRDVARGLLDDLGRNDLFKLFDHAVFHQPIHWVLPLTHLIFTNQQTVTKAALVRTSSCYVALWSYNNQVGMEIFTEVKASCTVQESRPVMVLDVLNSEVVQQCKCVIHDGSEVKTACGNWTVIWNDAVFKQMGRSDSSIAPVLVRDQILIPLADFGATQEVEYQPRFVSLSQTGELLSWPATTYDTRIEPELQSMWAWPDSKVNFQLYQVTGDHAFFRRLSVMGDLQLCQDFIQSIDTLLSSHKGGGTQIDPKYLGLFDIKHNDLGAQRCLAYCVSQQVQLLDLQLRAMATYDHGFAHDGLVLLHNESNDHQVLSLGPDSCKVLDEGLKTADELQESEERLGAIVLEQGDQAQGCMLTLDERTVFVEARSYPIETAAVKQYVILPAGASELAKLSIQWALDEPIREYVMPKAIARRFNQALDVRSTGIKVAGFSFAQLYEAYAASRKRMFLMGMFYELQVLDMLLDEGTTLRDTMTRVDMSDEKKLLKDKALLQEVFQKIEVLAMMLPGIRRESETFTALYPYYWVKTDEAWLSRVVGPQISAKVIAPTREDSIQRVRTAIRRTHAHYQRPLTMIESSIGPLERSVEQQLEKGTFKYQAKRFAPMAVTGVAAAGLGIMTGGLAPMLLVGMAGGTTTLFMNSFEKDKEFRMKLKRSATNILSWWEVYRSVVAVAMYEASNFIDQENVRLCQRDRHLIDSLNDQQRSKVLRNIQHQIRENLKLEAQGRHAAVYEGSDTPMSVLINQLENRIEQDMQQHLAQYLGMKNAR